MLKSEFIARTKYEPVDDEYYFIEEAYYEFDGDKDAFCKQWLKDKKNGYWEREYKLRKREYSEYMELKEQYTKLQEESSETIEWYSKRYNELVHDKAVAKEEADSNKAALEVATRAFDELKADYNKLMDALSVIKNAIA